MAWPRPSPLTSPSPARKPFAAHLESYRKAYAPANQPEADLVRTLAESYWRLERAHKLENALFRQILKQDDYKDLDPTVAKAQAWSDKDTGLQRMALYAQRIQRTPKRPRIPSKPCNRSAKPLTTRPRKRPCTSPNSRSPAPTASNQRNTSAPRLHGGFVYSPDEIKLALLRVTRLEEARARFSPAA